MTILNLTSDLCARIKNAQNINNDTVKVKRNNQTKKIVIIRLKKGFIQSYKLDYLNQTLKIKLKYNLNSKPFIKQIIQISKPSLRQFLSIKELKSLKHKHNYRLTLLILSTNLGRITDDEAIKKNLGGEILIIVK